MSAVVRKRLYDPEKGKTVPTEDEEDDRAIRPNSSLSSIAIVVGIGLLFVLLGVKMRDRSDYAMSSSSLDRVVNNVASAIAASPAKEQYQQEAAKPNQEQEAVTAAQENDAFNQIKAKFFERSYMDNIEGTSVPIRDSSKIERVNLLWHPENQVEGEALRHAFESAFETTVQPMENIEGQNFERGWILNVDGKYAPEGYKQIILWASSHVPPYDGGGGKHGISRLVRLVSAPSTKRSLGGEKEIADYVRWHCRISHVTAHTPTLTLDTKVFQNKEQIISKMGQIFQFIGLKTDDDVISKAEKGFTSYMAEHSPSNREVSFPSHLVPTFEQEVQRMASWPCGIFESDDRHLFNAACDQSWVACTIPWDICDKQQC